MSIWITSDLHLGHNRDFIWDKRGFSSVDEMNEEIIKRFNSKIKEDDEVYILGDLIVGVLKEELDKYVSLISSLHGKKYLIRGNHDNNTRYFKYLKHHNILSIYNAVYLDYNKYHFYFSHYPSNTTNRDDDKPFKARLINLCGHLHTQDKFLDMKNGLLSYHVELDAHDCYPCNLDDIIQDIKTFKGVN